MAIGIQTAHANNVVVDMSQVQDYNQYQMDLQQCEGLAVQNQPEADQIVKNCMRGRGYNVLN